MKAKLREYIDQIFADAPDNSRTRELKEEMYSNICDKYDDFIREGKSEAAAYNISISSIGDISELIEELKGPADKAQNEEKDAFVAEPKHSFTEKEKEEIKKYRTRGSIMTAVATALCILCWIPLVIMTTVSDTDLSATIGIVLMMVMIAIAVGLFIIKPNLKPDCLRGENFSEDDDDDDNDDDAPMGKRGKHPALIAIHSILWSLTVVIYLAVGFVTGAWHITWIIYLIAAAIDNVIEAVFGLALQQGYQRRNVVKLVIWVIVAIALLSVVGVILSGDGFPFGEIRVGGFALFGGYYYADGNDYNVGNREYNTDVTSIDLSWHAGTVNIVLYEGDSVKLSETGVGSKDEDKMRSRMIGDELVIKYAESGVWFFKRFSEKELTVYLPADTDLSGIEIDAASADIYLKKESSTERLLTIGRLDIDTASGIVEVGEGFSIGEADIDTASGDITLRGKVQKVDVDSASADLILQGEFGNVSLDTASGKVEVHGKLESLEMDAVSGEVNLYLENVPKSLEVDGVSGRIKVVLPANAGFTAELDSVSGTMSCNGDRGDHLSYGDRYGKFEFSTVSGNVEISY